MRDCLVALSRVPKEAAVIAGSLVASIVSISLAIQHAIATPIVTPPDPKDQSQFASQLPGAVPFVQDDPWKWIPVKTKGYGRYYYEQATGVRDADGDAVNPRIEVDDKKSKRGKRSGLHGRYQIASLVPVTEEEPYRPRPGLDDFDVELPETPRGADAEDDPLKALAMARAYVATTATPGGTMSRQGREKAVECLHPEFVLRLAATIKEARVRGLPGAGVFSACRPPAFGVGGFGNKFLSLHAYGLAVDVHGIGRPGSRETKHWHSIARRHGVVCPYGPYNRAEFNHCQPTETRAIPGSHPLRRTITAQGPIDLERMWNVAKGMIVSVAAAASGGQTQQQAARARVSKRYNGKRRYVSRRVGAASQDQRPLWSSGS